MKIDLVPRNEVKDGDSIFEKKVRQKLSYQNKACINIESFNVDSFLNRAS